MRHIIAVVFSLFSCLASLTFGQFFNENPSLTNFQLPAPYSQPVPVKREGSEAYYITLWTAWSPWSYCYQQKKVRVRGCYTYANVPCFGAKEETKTCTEADDSPAQPKVNIIVTDDRNPVFGHQAQAILNAAATAPTPVGSNAAPPAVPDIPAPFLPNPPVQAQTYDPQQQNSGIQAPFLPPANNAQLGGLPALQPSIGDTSWQPATPEQQWSANAAAKPADEIPLLSYMPFPQFAPRPFGAYPPGTQALNLGVFAPAPAAAQQAQWSAPAPNVPAWSQGTPAVATPPGWK